ncbi:hypothetical protein TUM4630_09510 [Shewanella algidipiscicola]|uniref:Uncharacterized protein n=1 Tax=Shewanella algidipiscicola TaxID=614070 RepID=A0ABQ4P9N6_9GAMM|nr:hypothetical protein TUM4630_09510 [Shewanella algidipiscicola]
MHIWATPSRPAHCFESSPNKFQSLTLTKTGQLARARVIADSVIDDIENAEHTVTITDQLEDNLVWADIL